MRFHHLLAGLGLFAGLAHAQTATANADAPSTPAGEPRATRAMGSALSAGIRYSPPPPEPEKKEPVEEEKPKNGIVRLPDYVVQGSRPPVFSEKALRDQKQKGKFLVKKHLSEFDRGVLNSVSGPSWSNFSNEKRAAQMEADENRQATLQTIDEQSLMYQATGDERRAREAQDDKYNTTLRSSTGTGTRSKETWYGELR